MKIHPPHPNLLAPMVKYTVVQDQISLLIDGSSFIHSSVPVQETFDGYASADFAGKVSKIANSYCRVDIVFDDYKER